MKQTSIIIFSLLAIIFVLVGVLIWGTPEPEIKPFDDTKLRQEIHQKDSIADFWETEARALRVVADRAITRMDSLEHLKPKIQHHYHEVYRTIDLATNEQLDSIIRANW